MKILIVTRENTPDKRYGLAKSLTPILTALQAQNNQIGYISQTDAGARSLAALRTIHHLLVKLMGRFFTQTEFAFLLWGILERLNMGRLAAQVMAREQYTHVHCQDPIIAAGYRWFARIRWFIKLRRGHTARWGVTEHGFGSYSQAFHEDGARLSGQTMRWLRNWERKILLKAHWVITPTPRGLQQLARDLAVYPLPKTWFSIPHPCPALKHYAKAEARQQLGWTSMTIYLLAVGRFTALKQFPVLIQACALLQHSDWQLILVGEGNNKALQQLAIDLKIAERVAFAVSDDMGLYYSAADIYVSVSTTEAFGLANLEALSMGLPSICTAVGGVPDVVGSGAYLIPAQDNRALVYALQTLLDDEEQRRNWTERARQWIKLYPTVKEISATYLAVYRGDPVPEITQRLELPATHFFTTWQQEVNQWKEICPLPSLLTLPKYANILMIAPHPDDEILGCGGTLALLKQRECHVKVIIVTDGKQGDPLNYLAGENVATRRRQETLAALAILNIDDVEFFEQADSHYRHSVEIAQRFNELLDIFRTDWLLLPSVLDYHRDHVAISLSLLEIWQQRGWRERVFFYETWTPVLASQVVDISAVFELKKQAIACHQLPLKYCDYDAFSTGMAMYRGLYLTAPPARYAEAFMELKANTWQKTLSHLMDLRQNIL